VRRFGASAILARGWWVNTDCYEPQDVGASCDGEGGDPNAASAGRAGKAGAAALSEAHSEGTAKGKEKGGEG